MFYPNSQWLSILRDRTLRTLDRCAGPQKEKRSRPTSTFTGAMWVSGKGREKIWNRQDSSTVDSSKHKSSGANWLLNLSGVQSTYSSFRSTLWTNKSSVLPSLTSLKSTDLPSFPRKTEHHNLPACFPKPKKSPNPRSLQSRKCMLSSPALWSASEGLADGWDWKAWRWWDWLVSFKQQIDGFFRTSFGVYIVFLGCALVPSLFR